MKTLVEDYAFNKTSKQVAFLGSRIPTKLEQILLITNVTSGDIIYNFADKLKKGSLSGNILTLIADTSTMSDSDSLQIFVDIPEMDFEVLLGALVSAINKLQKAQGFPDASGRVRVNLETGGTLGGVTTVTTLSNLGSYSATLNNQNNMNIGAKMLRSNIT